MTSCTPSARTQRAYIVLAELSDSLSDADDQDTQHIRKCGHAVSHLITQSATQLLRYVQGKEASSFDSNESYSLSTIDLTFETLASLAQDMINTIPFHIVPKHWLRLYTDVAILQSIKDVVMNRREGDGRATDELWSKAVRRLDMAIIVAGAIGNKRKDWVIELIEIIQAKFELANRASDLEGMRVTKKPRIEQPAVDVDPLLFAPKPIPVLQEPPDIESYLENHLDHPFIVRGYLNGLNASPRWPACERWASHEYLTEAVGLGRVVPVEVGKAYDDESWTQKIIPFTDFLRRAGFRDSFGTPLEEDATLPDSPLYLAQYGLFDQFPTLEKDMSFPDYVWSNPPSPSNYPSYVAPQNVDGLIVNVWVGSGNGEIISPAHTDPYYNCYAQVLGHKRVWLAPPECAPFMCAYGEGQIEEEGLAEQYMTNTSKIPILRPINHFLSLKADYPEFFEHVWPESLEAVLEPGDLMVMPPGWWHAMRGEGKGPAWSVSMWY